MYSYGPPHLAVQKQDDQLEHTFSSCVRIRDVVLRTCLGRWTIGRSGERGSGISVLPARHDDDDLLWSRTNDKSPQISMTLQRILVDFRNVYLEPQRQSDVVFNVILTFLSAPLIPRCTLLGWVKSFVIFWFELICCTCISLQKHFKPCWFPAVVGSIMVIGALTLCALLRRDLKAAQTRSIVQFGNLFITSSNWNIRPRKQPKKHLLHKRWTCTRAQ